MPVGIKKVLQITLSQEDVDRLDHLKQKLGMEDLSELIIHRFQVLEGLIDEVDKGKSIVIMDPKNPGEYETIGLFEEEETPPLQ